MWHIRDHALERPDAPAIVMARSGERLTYRELDLRSSALARLLHDRGLSVGDGVALMLENQIRFLEVTWAAQRSGLRYTAINSHLLSSEVQYIIDNSEARCVITSVGFGNVIAGLDLENVSLKLMMGGSLGGFESYEDPLRAVARGPLPSDLEVEGSEMLYSSGTTGRPKGIRKPISASPAGSADARQVQLAQAAAQVYGQDRDTVYLVPAPLYHAAPLVSSMSVHRAGGTVVVMEEFDARLCLESIERYRVTHAQFVPTMFVRLLRLPAEIRAQFDLRSLRYVIHAAAPCPPGVKQQIIDWFGPIVYEYYAGTEDIGGTFITSEEWLVHRGSVGRASPGLTIHILGEDGKETPTGSIGRVYFEGGQKYDYHGDPEKTAAITSKEGWRTLGDVGYLDESGYLFLSDRSNDMIVSGGVNIYPQETENVLIGHPLVADVAVIGVPNREFGEEVKAIVQLNAPVGSEQEMSEQLIEFCKLHMASFKCPRSVDFVSRLPRQENGKLYKRRLREQYWSGHENLIV